MMNIGENYKKLVTRVTGKDWDGDYFNRMVIHNHTEELDEYIDHLNCCDYKEIKVYKTRKQEVVTIDTPYDEEVKRTLVHMCEYFRVRVDDIDGKYLCDRLGITPETLKEQLEYLLKEV